MSQIPALISDLAVILISAGLVTLLFKKLKQPVVLGYIVAGILAGPSIEQIPTVTDVESIRIWADIGVIFLLFALAATRTGTCRVSSLGAGSGVSPSDATHRASAASSTHSTPASTQPKIVRSFIFPTEIASKVGFFRRTAKFRSGGRRIIARYFLSLTAS